MLTCSDLMVLRRAWAAAERASRRWLSFGVYLHVAAGTASAFRA